MTLSILSSRDADPNIEFSFTFTVSSGPPSHVECKTGQTQVFIGVGRRITREVIRSHYINSSLPDMTRVTVRVPPQPRIGRTYECIVSVRSLEDISTMMYNIITNGKASSFVTVTGEST